MMVDRFPGREVIAVRYASKTRLRSDEFQSYELYGEEDGPCTMANYFWIVRDPGRVVLVDTGFSVETAAKRGRTFEHEPLTALAELGIRPDDVDHVILTHMHFDHIGNVSAFPRANVTVARAEYEFWTDDIAQKDLFAWVVEPSEIQSVVELNESGRLSIVEQEAEVFSGIRVSRVGGHTEGSLIVEIDTNEGCTILASDALHLYEELEKDWPYFIFANLADMYRGYDLLRTASRQPGITIVPGHDPLVVERFPAVSAATPFAVRVG